MKIWKVLFFLTLTAVVWLGYHFAIGFYGYNRLSKSVPVNISSWEVREVAPSEYGVMAKYSFNGGDEVRYLFKPPYYPNDLVAKQMVSRMEGLSWVAYFDPKKPALSALQRYFPYKAAIHFGLALGVLIYFVWLFEYINRQSCSKDS